MYNYTACSEKIGQRRNEVNEGKKRGTEARKVSPSPSRFHLNNQREEYKKNKI